METTRLLRRSSQDRMIAGVMGGAAQFFGLDPNLLRVVYVIGSVMSAAFPGVLVYVLLWLVIPDISRHESLN
ncbi:MAG TPA: PspC domain-containing protein [Arenimonas sp.]|nr:PspC domain-containing protein [Arenimonas sp.]HPO25072.1 PspC domain-containing protein [Arenimonas sp.]